MTVSPESQNAKERRIVFDELNLLQDSYVEELEIIQARKMNAKLELDSKYNPRFEVLYNRLRELGLTI